MRADARKRQSAAPIREPGEKVQHLVTVYDSDNNVIAQSVRETDPGFLTHVTVTQVVV